MSKKIIYILVIAAISLLAAATQITIFVIQPLRDLPEGKTIIIGRLNSGKFVDSADAMCRRRFGEVNLICRISAIGAATSGSIYLRLPYSESLYLLTTDGRTYEY